MPDDTSASQALGVSVRMDPGTPSTMLFVWGLPFTRSISVPEVAANGCGGSISTLRFSAQRLWRSTERPGGSSTVRSDIGSSRHGVQGQAIPAFPDGRFTPLCVMLRPASAIRAVTGLRARMETTVTARSLGEQSTFLKPKVRQLRFAYRLRIPTRRFATS